MDGYFIGNFFGLNDTWAKINDKMIFLSKIQVLSLFSDFDIIRYDEKEWDGKTGIGTIKHWHIHDIVAKKK